MAIDSYTVETTLTLNDRLIVGLRRAAEVAGRLDELLVGIDKRLASMGRGGIAGITAGIDKAKASAVGLSDTLRTLEVAPAAVSGIEGIERSLGNAEARAARLRDTLATLRVPSSTGGGGSHGTRAGIASGAQSGASGRFHPSVGMNLPTGIGAAIGYGVYQEAQIQDLVSRVMLAANERILGPDLMLNPQAQRVRDIVRTAMSQTGMSETQAGEALMPAILQMAGLPLDERLKLAPAFEKFAFVESKLKLVEPGEASSALIGLLHMTGSYSPDQINKMASQLAFVSTVAPPSMGLPQIERMASYIMPSAMTAGIDSGPLLGVLAQAMSAGTVSTKSGTWFNDLLLSLSPKGGLAAMISTRGGKQRLGALEQLGMVEHGKNVGLEMLERGDWVGFSKTLADHLAKIPEADRLGVEHAAFGTQGGRAANLLAQPAFTQQLATIQQQEKSFLSEGLDAVIAKLSAADPVVQFHKTMADFTSALMDLGKVVLPPLTAALKGIDGTLKKLIPSLPGADGKPLGVGDIGTAAGVGAAIGGAVAGYPGAAIGAVVGAGGGAGVVGGMATWQWGAEHGVYIDPSSGAMFPLGGDASPPHASGFGRLGDWFSGGGAGDMAQKAKEGIESGAGALAAAVREGIKGVVLQVSIDGKAVAAVVTGHQAAEATRPTGDAAGHDPYHLPIEPAVPW